uniref:Large ribosomal subunit protein bL9c n=1 Tax=Liagora brachyclada TaxID=1884665 RepID=A0A1G4P087_9FLOR|nr:Ribosomal protein L9 [Liagora brachyclada]SCW24287.1 Ribosomal protein L9 [Liagora brachyclada]
MAKKKIQLILNSSQEHLGKSGSVVQVAQGYARNYLLPQKIAEPVTKNKLSYIKYQKAKQDLVNQEKRKLAIDIKSQLEAINKFSIKRKVSDSNNIFGSITDKDINEIITQTTGITLEKYQITMPSIKTIGLYDISIQLMNEVNIQLKLQLLPETT